MKTIFLLALTLLVISSPSSANQQQLFAPKTSEFILGGEAPKLVPAQFATSTTTGAGNCSVTKTYIEHYTCNDNISRSV